MIPRKVNLGEKSLKLMSGQDFANAGQTEDMRYNKMERPLVLCDTTLQWQQETTQTYMDQHVNIV